VSCGGSSYRIRETIEQRGRELFVGGEDREPFRKREILGDDRSPALVPVRNQIEQQLAAGGLDGHDAELVDGEDLDAEQPLLKPRDLARTTGFEELPHQVCWAGKEHATKSAGRVKSTRRFCWSLRRRGRSRAASSGACDGAEPKERTRPDPCVAPAKTESTLGGMSSRGSASTLRLLKLARFDRAGPRWRCSGDIGQRRSNHIELAGCGSASAHAYIMWSEPNLEPRRIESVLHVPVKVRIGFSVTATFSHSAIASTDLLTPDRTMDVGFGCAVPGTAAGHVGAPDAPFPAMPRRHSPPCAT
jgi:hypothetical protein